MMVACLSSRILKYLVGVCMSVWVCIWERQTHTVILIACNLTCLFVPFFFLFFLYQLICWLHFQLFFASGFIFRWKNARHTVLLSGCHGDHSLLSCLVIHQERIALDRERGKCLQSAAEKERGSLFFYVCKRSLMPV